MVRCIINDKLLNNKYATVLIPSIRSYPLFLKQKVQLAFSEDTKQGESLFSKKSVCQSSSIILRRTAVWTVHHYQIAFLDLNRVVPISNVTSSKFTVKTSISLMNVVPNRVDF